MLDLFWAEFRRSWIQFIRYPVEAVGGIFITTTIFYGLFASARYVVGDGISFGDRFEAIVIGYVLWALILAVMNDIAIGLQYEAQTGTLEQVFLAPYGAARVFLVRAIASIVLRLSLILTILGIIIALTGARLAFPPSLFLPLIAVLMGAYGLAFIAGALALLLKRVQQLLGIFQFALLFLIATPFETWTGTMGIIGQVLPMTMGAGLLRDLMAREVSLNWLKLALALLNSGVYLGIGLACFRLCERQAKKRGNLGGY